jgi:peptide/nickel transport system substrate-binding protein
MTVEENMMNYRYIVGICVSGALLILIGCQPVVDTSFTPPTRLRLAVSEEPATLDPQRTSEQSAQEIFQFVCEPLAYQGVDLLDHPLLAASWEMADNGLSMTVMLRQDTTFHDDTPLDAEAVKFTFERLKASESVASPIYDDVQTVTIDVLDRYTVEFQFEEPRYDFLATLRNPYAAILSPTAIQADELAFGRSPMCTGPYKMSSWESAQRVLLIRNQDYAWAPAYYENQGSALIDELELRFVSEHDTRYLALLNQELDMLSLSTPEEVAEIQASGQFDIYERWVDGISYLGFNYQRSPTNELAVRQAIAHAIDKVGIVSAVLPGLAEPAFAPLAPSVLGFSQELAEFEYRYDPERSRELIADAGFVDNDGDGIVERDGEPLQLELLTTTSSTYNKVFTLLQSELRAIGVDVSFRSVPTSEISQITPTGEFDLLLYHYNWPYPSAIELFLSTERVGASNRVAYSNAAVDLLLNQQAALPDNSAEKHALLFEAQKIILQDAPWQPLLVRKIVTAVNRRVQGVKVHPREGILLNDASIEEVGR